MEYEDISQACSAQYTPLAVLVAYRKEGWDGYALESHRILKDGSIGAAKPVSRAFMEKIAAMFSPEYRQTPHGMLPDNLLYADCRPGRTVLCWWTPPGPRTMVYSGSGLKDGTYNMPGTVYVVQDGRLSVYAFPGRKPRKTARLLYGPFYNYYENCSMCLGNSKAAMPDNLTWEALCRHWEHLFWDSINAHTICNPMKEGAILSTELKASMDKPFDTTKLKPAAHSLEGLLKQLENGKK